MGENWLASNSCTCFKVNSLEASSKYIAFNAIEVFQLLLSANGMAVWPITTSAKHILTRKYAITNLGRNTYFITIARSLNLNSTEDGIHLLPISNNLCPNEYKSQLLLSTHALTFPEWREDQRLLQLNESQMNA